MINWDRVAGLKDEVGAEDFDEVVELFLLEVEDVTERLAQSVNHATLEHDMHFLKSSALTLGFQGFAELCQKAETLCASGQASSVNVAEVLDAFTASKVRFLNELPHRAAA